MKKYMKSAAVILLVLVMTFTVVACNKKPMVTQQILDKEIAKGKNVAGKVTFTYSPAQSSADSKQAADNFLNAFEKKYTNVEVERDYTATSDTRIASGDIGDVFYFAETSTYKYAIKDKALVPLEGFIESLEINQSDVYGGIYALGLINGHLYFVARDYNQMGLIYNKSALAEKGLTSSVHKDWTWSEFLTLCEQLESEDYYGASINLAYSPVYTAFFEAYTYRNSWCSTSEKQIKFIDEDGLILKAVGEALDSSGKGYMAISSINASEDPYKGKEAIFNTTVYPGIQAAGKQYDNKDIDWDMINMPLFENPSFGCGSSGVGVYSRSQNVSAAAALALFFYTQEGQTAFNSGTGGSVPLLKSLDDQGYNEWKYPNHANWSTKNWDAWVYLADTASTPGQVNCRMPIEIAEAIDGEVGNILRKALNGTTSYIDGFAALETKCNELWSKLTG